MNIGMALKHEGYPVSVWDAWSRRDMGRYHAQECEKKWRSFQGNASPVTAGTIVQMALDRGWKPAHGGHELDWDDEISAEDYRVVDKNWVEEKEVHEPDKWDPAKQLIKYLEILFEASERVGYVTRTYERDGRFLPSKGCWDRTAGQLIQQLSSVGMILVQCLETIIRKQGHGSVLIHWMARTVKMRMSRSLNMHLWNQIRWRLRNRMRSSENWSCQ